MSKKLVIISIDALGALDLTGDLDGLPNLRKILRRGTHVKEIEAIYPSLTYPSHTTILTGVYPKKHGVINNTKIQPNRKSPDWYWYYKEIQSKTLIDLAKEKKLTTAAFLWPVTASSPIDWNIAEIFPNRIWTNQVLVSLKASSPLFLFEMNRKYGHLRKGIQQPYLDDFITACSVDTLLSKKPDLTLIHLVDMDSMRHRYGVNSIEAKEALLRQDQRVGQIIDATKKAGTFNDTTFVVLGDHYQIDVSRMIRLNAVFAEKGWLTAAEDGTVQKDFEVYSKSCDGSAYIYCKKESHLQPHELENLLLNQEGIESVYTSEEAEKFGAAPNCTFMVEAKRGYYFVDESVGAVVEEVKGEEIGEPERYRAVHGFAPWKKDYATTFVAMGPEVLAGKVIEKAYLVDEAPTFAKLLGLKPFPDKIAGKVIEGLFKT